MKISVITGATSGLGFELAKEMVKKGKNIIIIGRREEKLKEALEELSIINPEIKVIPYKMDISKENEINDFVKYLDQKSYEIEFLFNNAGLGVFGKIETITMEKIETVFGANLIGLIMITSKIASYMKENKNLSRIVNILSTAALKGKGGESLYCASKWGALGFLKALTEELKEDNIEVLNIYPGGMNTEFWEKTSLSINTEKFMTAKDVAVRIVDLSLDLSILVSDITINRAK